MFIKKELTTNIILKGNRGSGKNYYLKYYLKKNNINVDDIFIIKNTENRGIDLINNDLETFCKKTTSNNINIKSNKKILIIKNAENMTKKCQSIINVLLLWIAKNMNIILITNDLLKIIESIQDKCIIINFDNINDKKLINLINIFLKNINFEISEKKIKKIINDWNYDIRIIFSNIEILYYNNISKKNNNIITKWLLCYNYPNIFYKILNNIIAKKYILSIYLIKKTYWYGYNYNDIIIGFIDILKKKEKKVGKKNMLWKVEINENVENKIKKKNKIYFDNIDIIFKYIKILFKAYTIININYNDDIEMYYWISKMCKIKY